MSRKFNNDLTAQQVRDALDYEPDTGTFRWRRNPRGGSKKAGDVAGYLMNQGYWCIMIGGKSYLAHRLAWLHVKGVWPSLLIDHENGNKSDNRFVNLREADEGQNTWNSDRRGWYRRSGRGKPFGAKINPNGTQIYLGSFDTINEARSAYLKASQEHYGQFSLARRSDA